MAQISFVLVVKPNVTVAIKTTIVIAAHSVGSLISFVVLHELLLTLAVQA